MGLPFVTSADLVSAYPAKSLEIADYVDDLIPLLAMTQNAQTGVTYSFLLADFTKLVTLSNASAIAVTLPLEATVAWATGTQLRLLNLGAGTVTVAGAAGVTINGTPLTLAQYKGANIIKTGTNTWVFIPFASGSAAAVITSTTGSPTVTTDGAATVYKFTGDGTFVVGTAGTARLHLVGAGAGAYSASGLGGGAGGMQDVEGVLLVPATYTVKVGAGTASGANGQAGDSYITGFLGSSGGGGFSVSAPIAGASTGAGSPTARNLFGQGNIGFAGAPGGGGGAGGAGTTGTAAGSIGPGRTSDVLVEGVDVTYAAGGQGGTTNTNGPANTGNGGAGNTGSGGSGIFVVRT